MIYTDNRGGESCLIHYLSTHVNVAFLVTPYAFNVHTEQTFKLYILGTYIVLATLDLMTSEVKGITNHETKSPQNKSILINKVTRIHTVGGETRCFGRACPVPHAAAVMSPLSQIQYIGKITR